jgi:hypothetical protein
MVMCTVNLSAQNKVTPNDSAVVYILPTLVDSTLAHLLDSNSYCGTITTSTVPDQGIGGTITENSYPQGPSSNTQDLLNPADIQKSGSSVNYVFGRGNKTVYMFNNTGVLATIPQHFFVTPKK